MVKDLNFFCTVEVVVIQTSVVKRVINTLFRYIFEFVYLSW